MSLTCSLAQPSLPRHESKLELAASRARANLRPLTQLCVHVRTMALQYPICGFVSLSLKLDVSHLRVVHAKDRAFNIMCGVGGCREVFRAFSAFNSHIYRHHRDAIGISQFRDDSTVDLSDRSAIPACSVTEYDSHTFAFENNTCSSATKSTTRPIGIPPADMKEEAARFLLLLREGWQKSQVVITDVVTGCKNLCQHAILLQ